MREWEQRAIESVRAGAPDLEAIYRAFATPMKQTAARKLEGSDSATLGLSAEDVFGAVIEGICDGSVKLDPSVADHLRAYLRRIAANKAVSLMRSRGAETRARAKQHSVDLTDVETDVETVVLAEQVEQRLDILTARERHVIIEHVKKGRPRSDVADELNCTPQNVSQLRKSALRKLFAELHFTDADSYDHRVSHDDEGQEGSA